jgi:hypothetical protein
MMPGKNYCKATSISDLINRAGYRGTNSTSGTIVMTKILQAGVLRLALLLFERAGPEWCVKANGRRDNIREGEGSLD